MKLKRLMAAASCLVLAIALPASGQILTANIPFEFNTADRTLPAGQYQLTVDIPGHRLNVVDENGVASTALFMTKTYAAAPRGKAELVFHKYGEDYFLRQIRTSAADISMPVPKAEAFVKRASTGNRGPKMALVRVSLQ